MADRAELEARHLCEERYDDLRPTANPLERRCDRCKRPVHLVRSAAQATELLAKGQGVAIQRRGLPVALDAIGKDARLQAGPRAVHALEAPWVDLDRHEPTTDLLWNLSPDVARARRVIPVARDGGDLLVASDNPTPRLQSELAAQLGIRVHLAMADSAALSRSLERHYALHDAMPGGDSMDSGSSIEVTDD
jgi:hypothetical protein